MTRIDTVETSESFVPWHRRFTLERRPTPGGWVVGVGCEHGFTVGFIAGGGLSGVGRVAVLLHLRPEHERRFGACRCLRRRRDQTMVTSAIR